MLLRPWGGDGDMLPPIHRGSGQAAPGTRGSRGAGAPLGNLHNRVAVRLLRTVTPACVARPPRAAPA